jgi:hypothetical protein
MWPAVHYFGGGRLQEGKASELWGINVAKAYSDAENDGKALCSASLHWTDGGKLVCFASRHTDRHTVLLEEKEWVMGEVLDWLSEQVGQPVWCQGGCRPDCVVGGSRTLSCIITVNTLFLMRIIWLHVLVLNY